MDQCKGLKQVLFGGEVVGTGRAVYFRGQHSGLLHVYGPTEAT